MDVVGSVEVQSVDHCLADVVDAQCLCYLLGVEGGVGELGVLVDDGEGHGALDLNGLDELGAFDDEADGVGGVVGGQGVGRERGQVDLCQECPCGFDLVAVSLHIVIVEAYDCVATG